MSCVQWEGRCLSQYSVDGTYSVRTADNRIISLLHLPTPFMSLCHTFDFLYHHFFYHFGWYYQAMTSRAFWLRVGFGSGLTKKFRFGFGYCAYYSLKANSLVILCNSILCKGTELTSEYFVIQIMLRKNWNIITTYSSLQPTAMPPIQKNSVVPKKQATKV